MATQAIQVVHFLPGRVRVKLPGLKGNTALAREVQHTLAAIDGIRHVEVSPITGSVLVLYNPGIAASFTLESLNAEAVSSLMTLADALGLSLEDIDMDELQRWLHAMRNGTHPGTPGELGSGVGTWFSSVQAGVAQTTSGLGDLRTLIPLTLCFLGFRSLLLTEPLTFPSWYDYLWFAFGTYVALNPTRPVRE
jgi:hypothetical protein